MSKKTHDQVLQDLSKDLCSRLLGDLERAKRPVIHATKCSLDNSIYDHKIGYFVPGDKKVATELNVGSVKKMTRAIFMLEILLRNLDSGAINTKRELYYISKGEIKHNPALKPLAFEDQSESDDTIDFLCTLLTSYREDLNVFANDRGGQTYSQNLIVTETLSDGSEAVIDLSLLGTSAFQPKNRPQSLKLSYTKKKPDFCLIIESEGTANTLVSNGFTKRNNCILLGSQGVPSNGVRGWCKLISNQLNIPLFFFGDLDSYTIQNIYRTLKAGSASSLIRNADFSAPEVKFLGVLPSDIRKYGLNDYPVNEKDVKEALALKKANDALKNDPFFKDKKNKGLADILRFLSEKKVRCEQQSVFGIDPKDPLSAEKFIINKIKSGDYV